MKTRWIRLARDSFLLIGVACIPAFAQLYWNGFEPPAAVPFGISVEEVKTHSEPIVWVDARENDLFDAGHVPGALNLNQSNWDQALPNLFAAYAPGKSIIVYCSPDCIASEEIAAKIRELGLEQVFVLEGGFDAWKKANGNL